MPSGPAPAPGVPPSSHASIPGARSSIRSRLGSSSRIWVTSMGRSGAAGPATTGSGVAWSRCQRGRSSDAPESGARTRPG